jgi:hypothetical protein
LGHVRGREERIPPMVGGVPLRVSGIGVRVTC